MDAESSSSRIRILTLGKLTPLNLISALTYFFADGGDARCVSQLYLLREFMTRLESKTGQGARVCDFFDLIIAVDTAALVLIAAAAIIVD